MVANRRPLGIAPRRLELLGILSTLGGNEPLEEGRITELVLDILNTGPERQSQCLQFGLRLIGLIDLRSDSRRQNR